jgi:hypothetical protein
MQRKGLYAYKRSHVLAFWPGAGGFLTLLYTAADEESGRA